MSSFLSREKFHRTILNMMTESSEVPTTALGWMKSEFLEILFDDWDETIVVAVRERSEVTAEISWEYVLNGGSSIRKS